MPRSVCLADNRNLDARRKTVPAHEPQYRECAGSSLALRRLLPDPEPRSLPRGPDSLTYGDEDAIRAHGRGRHLGLHSVGKVLAGYCTHVV